jgi:hypothetical protein
MAGGQMAQHALGAEQRGSVDVERGSVAKSSALRPLQVGGVDRCLPLCTESQMTCALPRISDAS